MLSDDLKAAANDTGLRVIDDAAVPLQHWLSESGVEAALVRPDRYVLGTARNADELAALLRRLPARAQAQPIRFA